MKKILKTLLATKIMRRLSHYGIASKTCGYTKGYKETKYISALIKNKE